MEKLKIEALRDLAIAHYPKASRMRANAVQYQGSIWADSGLMQALHFNFENYTATAVEKAAHELLQLTFMHPDAQSVDPVVWDAVEDAGTIAEKAHMLERAVEMQPQIEAALLDAARLLCELADVTLPGWVDAAGVQPAPIAKVGTNKKKWGDAELRALWDESILPGVTHTSLATKHGVTRQRIGMLLDTAKEKFSTMRTRSGAKNAFGQLIK